MADIPAVVHPVERDVTDGEVYSEEETQVLTERLSDLGYLE